MWARRRGSVHVNGVEDPLGELLELGSRGLRLLLQPLIVLPEPLDLSLEPQLLLALLGRVERREKVLSRDGPRQRNPTSCLEISNGEVEGPKMSRRHIWETRTQGLEVGLSKPGVNTVSSAGVRPVHGHSRNKKTQTT